jgi:hypothetical protein
MSNTDRQFMLLTFAPAHCASPRNRLARAGWRISRVVIWSLILFGCQADSDYALGRYAVTITTELSSCGAEFFAFSQPHHLPTSHVPGHQQAMTWQIRRIGITGTGADQIELSLLDDDGDQALLTLVGARDHAWLRVEAAHSVTVDGCELRRLITLSGQMEDAAVTGVIRTTLATFQPAAGCALPAPVICEVTERFTGARQPSEVDGAGYLSRPRSF